MKFVDVFQFLNYLLEEMSRCNCFSLQLVGGRLVGRTLEPKGEVCPGSRSGVGCPSAFGRFQIHIWINLKVEHTSVTVSSGERGKRHQIIQSALYDLIRR